MSKTKNLARELRDHHRAEVLSRSLRSPSELIEDVAVPADLMPALSSGRPELLKLLPPRTMDEKEVAAMFHLIAVLMETNYALQEHAREVASMAHAIRSQLQGAVAQTVTLTEFANFNAEHDVDAEA